MINNTYVECNPQLIDVYSFGVLIWAIMTGTKPYDAEVRKQRMSMWDLRTYVIGGGRPVMRAAALSSHNQFSLLATTVVPAFPPGGSTGILTGVEE